MTKTEIIKVVGDLQNDYKQKYKNWCIENPGYIMCNYAIKELACKNLISLLNDLNETDDFINILSIESDLLIEKSHFIKTMNGHFVHSQLYDEVIELITNK